MAYEQRELSGSLFKNNKKGKETHADYQGTTLIDGTEYYISAWTKEGPKEKWMSLAFKRKDSVSKPPEKPAVTSNNITDIEDDIPF